MQRVGPVVLSLQVAIAGYVYYRLTKYEAVIAAQSGPRAAKSPSSQSPGENSPGPSPGTPSHPRRPSIFDRHGPNPFINSTWHLTRRERLKLSLMSSTVFPLRVVLILLSLCATAGWLRGCMALGADPKRQSWATTYLIQWPLRIMARGILAACGYYYIPTTGQPATPEAAPIVVANHITFVDALFLTYAMCPCPVAEVANLRNPLLGPLLEAQQCILVDRQSGDSRTATKQRIHDRAHALAAGRPGRQVVIFPEASTHAADSLIHFKVGAFAPAVPVQPVFLNYVYRHFDPCWVTSGPGLGFLVFRMLCQFVNHAAVEYLPPVAPDRRDAADPRAFAQRVREALAGAGARLRPSGVRMTDHSVDDVALQLAAYRNSLPPAAAVVETEAIKQFFHVDVTNLKLRLQQFAKMDLNKDGRVSMEEFLASFAEQFHVPSEQQRAHLEELFHSLDDDESGYLDFREYLLGLALVAEVLRGL